MRVDEGKSFMLAEEVGQKQGNLVSNELFTKVNKQLGDTGPLQTLAKGDKLTVTVERVDGGKLRCTGASGGDFSGRSFGLPKYRAPSACAPGTR
jgi:hypothetical protein